MNCNASQQFSNQVPGIYMTRMKRKKTELYGNS